MTTPSNSAAGRFRLSEAIGRFVTDRGTTNVGRLLGLDRGTVGDKGSDLHRWRVDEILILAANSEEIAGALVANVRPQTAGPQAEAVALHGDLIREIAESGRVTGTIADALVDGRADREERAKIRAELMARRETDERVLAEIDAMDKAERGTR